MEYKEAWDETQRTIGNCSDKMFSTATPETILNHFKREVVELLEGHYQYPEGQGSELADCQLLLIHYAHKMKLSLYDEVIKKWEINKQRKWGKPDHEGVVSHEE